MNDSSHGDPQPPDGFHPWAERLCSRLTAGWRSGSRESIRVILDDCPIEHYDAVLAELIALEVELRVAAGETPAMDSYLSLFPQHPAVVQRAFDTGGENTSGGFSGAPRDRSSP